VQVGLGRFVCMEHYRHGFLPHDLDARDPKVLERARAVLEWE
jgi:hypothetical protein